MQNNIEYRSKQFIALARVSSGAQKNERTSLEAQIKAVRAYAASQNGEIVRLWADMPPASHVRRGRE